MRCLCFSDARWVSLRSTHSTVVVILHNARAARLNDLRLQRRSPVLANGERRESLTWNPDFSHALFRAKIASSSHDVCRRNRVPVCTDFSTLLMSNERSHYLSDARWVSFRSTHPAGCANLCSARPAWLNHLHRDLDAATAYGWEWPLGSVQSVPACSRCASRNRHRVARRHACI